jgi:hypothetical protein
MNFTSMIENPIKIDLMCRHAWAIFNLIFWPTGRIRAHLSWRPGIESAEAQSFWLALL